jgi:hypothetical protein
MPPKNTTGSRVPPSTRNPPQQSRTQGDYTPLDDDTIDSPERQFDQEGSAPDDELSQLRSEIRNTSAQQADVSATLKGLLTQFETMQAALTQLVSQRPIPSVERSSRLSSETPVSLQRDKPHYSKRQPDPLPLDNGENPTFESWKLQIQGKFRVNADHYETEESRMVYLFGRTTGNAQKHLRPRYDEDSPVWF